MLGWAAAGSQSNAARSSLLAHALISRAQPAAAAHGKENLHSPSLCLSLSPCCLFLSLSLSHSPSLSRLLYCFSTLSSRLRSPSSLLFQKWCRGALGTVELCEADCSTQAAGSPHSPSSVKSLARLSLFSPLLFYRSLFFSCSLSLSHSSPRYARHTSRSWEYYIILM